MPTSRSASHTSTQQWQSFEVRMRYRRAERCVTHAQEALAAGREDDARAALAEARALNSEAPSLEDLAAAIQARRAAEAHARRSRRQRMAAAIVVAVLATAAASAGWWLRSADTSRQDNAVIASPTLMPPASSPRNSAELPPPSDPPPPASRSESAVPVRTSGKAETAAEQPQTPTSAPSRGPNATRSITEPPAEPALPPVQEVNPPPALDRPTTSTLTESAITRVTGSEGLVKSLPSAGLPVVTLPPPAAAPAADAEAQATEPVEVSEEPKVRAVLAQFEAAYSSLSATAAQSVWPSVDARALARAFDSLASQQVSLGRCSILIKGASARAECLGTASWTPKVGGGRHTASRRFEFDLAAENGSWQILQAIAR